MGLRRRDGHLRLSRGRRRASPPDRRARLRRRRQLLPRRTVDRLLVDARCLQPVANRRRGEPAREQSELLRRDLHHARRWDRTETIDRRPGVRWRSLLHARRLAHRLAALRCAGTHRRRVDDEAGRKRPEADHRFRIDELGALRASFRRIHHLRVEQARLRELRAVHRRRGGDERTGPRHVLGRLRRSSGPLARREHACMDVEPIGRGRGTAVPGGLEPRVGARRHPRRAAA